MIDLKQKMEGAAMQMPMEPSKEWYPTAYLRDVEGLDDVSLDQEVTMKGVVKSVTKRERDGKSSFEIEVELRGMDAGGKKSEKMKKTSDEDELDEKIESAMKKKD
jgi:hypothetical protein